MAKSPRELDLKAFHLRRQGMTFADIAATLGWSHKAVAFQAYQRALAEWGPIVEDIEAAKLEQIDRLDAMLRAVWPDAEAGSEKAIDQVLKIQRQQAVLLGLGQPAGEKPADRGEAAPVSELEEFRRRHQQARAAGA